MLYFFWTFSRYLFLTSYPLFVPVCILNFAALLDSETDSKNNWFVVEMEYDILHDMLNFGYPKTCCDSQWQIVVTHDSRDTQGDSLAIVGWLVKHYYHVQQ
jgi:hypothetical protein